MEREVVVLRLGHRPGRDHRMTTHVGLTARALGADRAILAGQANQSVETVREVTNRFGGPFEIRTVESGQSIVHDWDGEIVHLTMYGIPVQDVVDGIRSASPRPLLVVVGAEKVQFDVFAEADYNIAITNQPHSEVASLAVFLDRLFEGRELEQEWVDAEQTVIPRETGKSVESPDESMEEPPNQSCETDESETNTDVNLETGDSQS